MFTTTYDFTVLCLLSTTDNHPHFQEADSRLSLSLCNMLVLFYKITIAGLNKTKIKKLIYHNIQFTE
jgi:hypothetical protein